MAKDSSASSGLLYGAVVKAGFSALQANALPDFLVRRAARHLMSARLKSLRCTNVEEELEDLTIFAQSLKEMPIAIHASDANTQHYEVPTEFYKLVLGKNLKYSASLFLKDSYTLEQAEEAMLELYCTRAQLNNGQTILDLGCGWGSLSLYVAAKYPNSRITSVSNSATQRDFIVEEAKKRGLSNVEVIVSDVTVFQAGWSTFDRILSIEMFEHMKNYQKLLNKVASWMKPDGLLFIHIFTHKLYAYHFEDSGEDDWMARSFFTGGTMPADSLLLYFQDDVSIVSHWRINGTHYARTSEAWLKRMDQNLSLIRPIFVKTYGESEVTKWIAFWRTFFIAVAELFNFDNGQEWMVSHYLFKRKS